MKSPALPIPRTLTERSSPPSEGLLAAGIYRAALDSCSDATLILDRTDHRLVYANKAAKSWLHGTCVTDDGTRLDLSAAFDPDPFLVADNDTPVSVVFRLRPHPDPVARQAKGPPVERMATVHTAGNHITLIFPARDRQDRPAAVNLDPLTGLPGRDIVLRWLENGFSARPSGNSDFAVLFIDLDDFKAINDCSGHLTGDAVLAAAARRMACCVRSEDLFARYGGDEFIAVLSHVATEQDAVHIADRIRRCLAEPLEVFGAVVRLTASVGIAAAREGFTSTEDILRTADQRMYADKNQGSV